MQQRHYDRRLYFYELADTAREFYIDYLRPHIALTPQTSVLEIGCGEGGNLLPFAELGCRCMGIDISERRISEAKKFFREARHRLHQSHGAALLAATFLCGDFLLAEPPQADVERFDLILVHDVIEHIAPKCKRDFLLHIRSFLKTGGIVFFGFPAWHNPFGGHQQIAAGWASKLPFIHLLPGWLYRALLKRSGTAPPTIDELMSIRRARMTVEGFEHLAAMCGYTIGQRTLWLINPHYKQKFRLRPRRQWACLSCIPYVRNFYTTSAFYILK